MSVTLGYVQPSFFYPKCIAGKMVVLVAGSSQENPSYGKIYDPVSFNQISPILSIDSNGYVDNFLVDNESVYDIYVYDKLNNLFDTIQNVSIVGGGGGSVPGAPGSSVYLTVNPDGSATISDDSGNTTTIRNGTNGTNGTNGANGTNGTNGTNGVDGAGIAVIRIRPDSPVNMVEYSLTTDPYIFYEVGALDPDGKGLVKTNANDAMGYLNTKIEAVSPDIEIVEEDNKLKIKNLSPETFKTKVNNYTAIPGFLADLFQAGDSISITPSADFAKLIISASGVGGSGFYPRGAWSDTATYNKGDGVWYYDDSVTPVINRYYVATEDLVSTNPYTVGTGWVIMFSIDQLGDVLVKLDANDTQADFLLSKLIAGTGITFERTDTAEGSFITIKGSPSFTITTNNGTKDIITDLSSNITFADGVCIIPQWNGNQLIINHKTIEASGTATTLTATGLPQFDDFGHYQGTDVPITTANIDGLDEALEDAGDGKVSVNAGDTKGYLASKVTAGSGVQIDNQGDHLVISSNITDSSTFSFKSNYNNANNSGYVAIDQVIFGSQFIDAPNHKIHNLPAGKLLLSTNLKAVSNFGNFDYSEDCYSGSTGTQTYIIGDNNPTVKFSTTSFGTWTEYQSKYTGYSSQPYWSGYTRRVVEVAGKQLVNLGCNLYSKQNGNGGVTLYLKHYSSLNVLKSTYQVNEGDWTNLMYQEPSLAQYRQLTKCLVIDCEESDYFTVDIKVRGDGPNSTDIRSGTYVTDVTLNGALLSGNQYNFPIAQVNTFVTQYSSTGSVKNYYDHKFAFSEYTNESSCKTFLIDMAVGDYITLTYSAGSYVADIQYEVHGTTCVGAKGDKGDPGDLTVPIDHLLFDPNSTFAPVEGSLSWNSEDHTLNLGLSGGSSLQLGQEEVVYAVNKTGSTIQNGEVVYISGNQGNRIVASRAQAILAPSSQVCIAIATQPVNNNKAGYFTRFGLVRQLNTSMYTEGDILYVSTIAGALTKTPPAKPYSQIGVAVVARTHASEGIIMVSPFPLPRIGQLTDVLISNPVLGETLVYDGTKWINQEATGGGGGGGTSAEVNLDGLQTYPVILSNGAITTGHTSEQGALYSSARVIPAAHVEANYISCYAIQLSSFYGLRMGIYLPGVAGDTLIAQTDVITTLTETGIVTLPLLYGPDGSALGSPLVLNPNTSYMLATVIKANGSQLAAYTGISTNPPNHFGRQDGWNPPAPSNLLSTTASYTQTNQLIWMSVSK